MPTPAWWEILPDKGEKSPAEHNFFSVVGTTVADQAIISVKVGVGDPYYVKSNDSSQFRIYRDRIDRQACPKGFCFVTRRPFALGRHRAEHYA